MTIRGDNEKQIEAVKTSLLIAKEQLEIDKAALIEKAEEEQKKCEKDVRQLEKEIQKAESANQETILTSETKAKEEEEAFVQEESALKEALRVETERRDYEQKLFEQEKSIKEKELVRLRDEYEKKKWYWDNQLRNLHMRKSVQEAEFDSEKMRVDREARVGLRNLEAKRDELKQVLSGLKNRLGSLKTHGEKELELGQQRWRWRKERLWSMWQNRLDLLKKERKTLQDQLAALDLSFQREREALREGEHRNEGKISDLQQILVHSGDQGHGQKRSREIQLELEKTKLLAQIKECETLIGDWKDRLIQTQAEVGKRNLQFGNQLSFVDQFFRQEEKESELFLSELQKMLAILEERFRFLFPQKDAA